MKTNSLEYCVKVWLTTGIISPLTFILLDALFGFENLSHQVIGIFGFVSFAIVFGLILSTPSFLILLSATVILSSKNFSEKTIKLMLSISSILLTIIPLLLLFGKEFDFSKPFNIKIVISYVLTAILALAFYKLVTIKQIKTKADL